MVGIREVDRVARDAGLPRIRSGRWELRPAFNYLEEVSRLDDLRALIKLRAIITQWGGPRMQGLALGVSGVALLLTSFALVLAGSDRSAPGLDLNLSLYVIIGLTVGCGVGLLGFYGNDRESSAAGWLYVLDQRIAELRERESTSGRRGSLVSGHAEFVAIKFGGGKR